LANSISPPAVRFTADGAAVTGNPFGLVPTTRRTSNFNQIFFEKKKSLIFSHNTTTTSNSTISIKFKSCSTTKFEIIY
jgi:hypothetical protein